jgi:hypothetical protein
MDGLEYLFFQEKRRSLIKYGLVVGSGTLLVIFGISQFLLILEDPGYFQGFLRVQKFLFSLFLVTIGWSVLFSGFVSMADFAHSEITD